MVNLQRAAGSAALVLGTLLLALLALLAVLAAQGYGPGGGNDAAKALAFAASSPLPNVVFLLYIAYAGALLVIVFGLHERLMEAPATMRLALAAGVVGSALFLTYALLGWVGEPALVSVYQQDAAAGATTYRAVRAVSNALNTGAIFATGWAMLLAGAAAWAGRALPRGLSGLLAGSGGLSVLALLIPVLSLVGTPLAVAWSFWLGVVLLRTRAAEHPTVAGAH